MQKKGACEDRGTSRCTPCAGDRGGELVGGQCIWVAPAWEKQAASSDELGPIEKEGGVHKGHGVSVQEQDLERGVAARTFSNSVPLSTLCIWKLGKRVGTSCPSLQGRQQVAAAGGYLASMVARGGEGEQRFER